MAYDDNAVFMPSTGAVYTAPAGTEPPSLEDIDAWVKAGRTGDVGTAWKPIGYTSIDELPELGADIEGGETKGVWENSALRTTAVKTTETLVVSPVEWNEAAAKRRFGAGATLDSKNGRVSHPKEYSPITEAVCVFFVDGDRVLGFHRYKGETSPEGEIKLDTEEFAAAPYKYTFLNPADKPARGYTIGAHLKTVAVGGGA